jgi:hypothetical protein
VTRRTLRRTGYVALVVVVLAGVAVGAYFAGRSSAPAKVAATSTAHHTKQSTAVASTNTSATTTTVPPTATTAAPAPTTTTAPPEIPQVADCGGAAGTRPTSLYWCTSECSSYMTNITWTTWGPDSAVGTGTWVTKTTTPRTGQAFVSCAQSVPVPHPNSPIELSTPQYVNFCTTGGAPTSALLFTHANVSVGVTVTENTCRS